MQTLPKNDLYLLRQWFNELITHTWTFIAKLLSAATNKIISGNKISKKKEEDKLSNFSKTQRFFISQNPNCYVNLFQKLWFEEWGSIFQKTVGFLIWWLTSSLINFHTNDFVQQFLLQIWFSHTKVQVADRSTWHFPIKYGHTNVRINWNVNKESLHNGGGW